MKMLVVIAAVIAALVWGYMADYSANLNLASAPVSVPVFSRWAARVVMEYDMRYNPPRPTWDYVRGSDGNTVVFEKRMQCELNAAFATRVPIILGNIETECVPW